MLPSITWAKYRPTSNYCGIELGSLWFVDVLDWEGFTTLGYVSANGTFHEDI